jgi:PTS system glucose-specific IIA component
VTLQVRSPIAGTVLDLTDVPDPVFAQAMVGPGVAVRPPKDGRHVLAPVDGTVITLHPHAFVVASASGVGVLVHLGIDTVRLKGDGFTLHVVKGETVRAGQPLVDWDPAAIEAAGYSTVCPVIALDAGADALAGLASGRSVGAGDVLFTWHV